jgi:hypothetical protein
MKIQKIVTLFLLLTGLMSMKLAAQGISLSSAIANRQIQANIQSTGLLEGVNTNSHIGKCIAYNIKNTSGKPIAINVEAGSVFKPNDTTIQPLLLTENKSWVLAAGATITGFLNGLCANLNKGGPKKSAIYKFDRIATGVMKKFAQFIAKKNYQTGEAQSVLWAITNKSDLYGSLDAKNSMCSELKEFVKKEMGINPDLRGQIYVPKKENIKRVSVRVAETFSTADSGSFVIQIFDEKGNLKLQQKLPDQKSPGEVTYAFWIGTEDLPTGKYSVKYLIQNKEAHQTNFELKFDEE